MSVVSSSPAASAFELRNATLTLIALALGTTDLGALAAALEERFGPTPALFDHDPVVIDLSRVEGAEGAIDFDALSALLKARRLLPVGVEGGTAEQREGALAAGLAEAVTYGQSARDRSPPAAPEPKPARAPTASAKPAPARTNAAPAGAVDAAASATKVTAAAPTKSMAAAATKATTAAPAAPSTVPTLVIDRPLRSGQQVYARGGDLVVMAAVNFGAEVIADGHIHVYAPLRGRAIAGARGNTAARIFSTCMEPQLVSIAGTYLTTDTALADDVHGKPAQVYLDGETLVVEALAA